MPYTDETVNNLIINVLTNSQYDSITTPSDTELYLITDDPNPITNVKVNGTSIVSNGEANLVTNTAYNASSNKIATMSDVPTVTSTYSSTGTNAVNGAAVHAALQTLDSYITAETGKAISAFTITDGQISAATKINVGDANQNAFSNIKVGSSTIAADTTTDTLELVASTGVILTPDTANDTVTISAGNVSHDDSASAGSATPINADQLQGYTISTLVSAIKTNLVNTLYPVDSIYLTYTNTNPSTILGGTWQLVSSIGLASEHVFGNDYAMTLTGSTDSAPAKRVLYSYSGYTAVDKNTYGQTKGTSVSSAGTSALSNYVALGVVSKIQAGNNPEYSGLIADTITLYTWRRTA